ncbi:hypothetical protein FRB99_004947 [Tulasnella sp. 403]|nr:hypothetical protein FRB99_004947 [Tulasnella sp. 403]
MLAPVTTPTTWGISDQDLKHVIVPDALPKRNDMSGMNKNWKKVEDRLCELAKSREGHPKKRALVVTISYQDSRGYGTVKGASGDQQLLLRRLLDQLYTCEYLSDFSPNGNPKRYASYDNICDTIQRMVKGCQKGDELVLIFCGHGKNGWEGVKGTTIFTADGRKITPKELNEWLVSKLNGASLTAFFDIHWDYRGVSIFEGTNHAQRGSTTQM